MRLREELDREREERNYFQLERDKIHTFWETTDRQLEEVKAQRKNLDKDIEEDEGRHQVEIKVYKQKMKHLLCEHQNMISELRADGLVSTELMQKEQEQLENELHKEMRAIMVDMQELDNESLIRELELEHDEKMTETRNSCEKQLAEVKAKYEKKMEQLPQELDNMRKNETSERENHWSNHIMAIVEDHKKILSDSQKHNVLKEDFEEFSSMEMQLRRLRVMKKEKDKFLAPLLKENNRLAKLLSKLDEEYAEKEKGIQYSLLKKDTRDKARLKQLNDLKSYHEALEQKFSKLQLEVNELSKTFPQDIQKLQQKADLTSALLEGKVKSLTDRLERTQAQLSSLLSVFNVDQTSLGNLANITEPVCACRKKLTPVTKPSGIYSINMLRFPSNIHTSVKTVRLAGPQGFADDLRSKAKDVSGSVPLRAASVGKVWNKIWIFHMAENENRQIQ
ncbi:hypothetical protein L3Q82_008996 [Scortum barcoo]|uniref:Uncharacterized protein n=1 Tax=Scortum barcoo TaxID=214431 RepID=A0ACB8XCJ4_9TELE|nr:hypothetical protein L3Q82_008996 [Scortum barcoo]